MEEDDINYKRSEWYKRKSSEFNPGNSLRMRSTIEWFRTRKSSHTNEKYLHTGEELRQKETIQKLVKQLNKVKPLHHHIKINSEDLQTLQDSNRFQRQNSRKANLSMTATNFYNAKDRSISYSPNNKQGNLTSTNSPRFLKSNNYEKCILATLKTVEIDSDALSASRIIEGKVQSFQRQQIHKRIHYPINERDARNCVRQFVELFKKDCDSALQESNDFYQMKKIQLKSTITKFDNQFNRRVSEDAGLGNLSFDQNTIQYKRNNQKPVNTLVDEFQSQLKYSKSPQEIQYLERIEKIIKDAKANIADKTKREFNE